MHSVKLKLTTSGDSACIAVDERLDLKAARNFCLMHVLRNIHGLACWYIASAPTRSL